jgi:hypothetical protein
MSSRSFDIAPAEKMTIKFKGAVVDLELTHLEMRARFECWIDFGREEGSCSYKTS